MSKIRSGIVGAAGYVGGELIRLLQMHPETEIVVLSRVRADEAQDLTEVHPQFRKLESLCGRPVSPFDVSLLAGECEVVFIAAPHGQAMHMAPALLDKGVKVIDIGADFRLKDAEVFEQWYKTRHTQPELLRQAVYGLPEVNREEIKRASLVANPGCYPTSAALALIPLVSEKLIDLRSIVVDSKSGVSGAGRTKMTLDYFFTEVVSDFKAYSVGTHRHTPEIEQTLSIVAGEALTVSFTPHLLPISRGILTTAYATLTEETGADRIRAAFETRYETEPFVRVLPEGQLPQIKYVIGSNFCDLGFAMDSRTNRVIVLSSLDNLVKGAAGQALQNMNLMFGLPETTGLLQTPFFP